MSSTGVRTWFAMASTVAGCLLVTVSRARAQQGSAGAAPVTIVISGQITTARKGEPLAGTDVTVVDAKSPVISAAATTDSTGRFSIAGLTPATYAIHLRRIGYAALDTTVSVSAGETLRLAFQMREQALGLPSVTVTGKSDFDPRMVSLEAHRKKGFGSFLTSEQLEQDRNRAFSTVLSQLNSSVYIVRGPDGRSKYLANRTQQAPKALRGGGGRPCFVQIIVNGVRIYGPDELGDLASKGFSVDPRTGMKSADDLNPPPDVDQIQSESLKGVEFYSSPSSTPVEYRNGQSECGTLVLWTRDR